MTTTTAAAASQLGLIGFMARKTLARRYAGSFLGSAWALAYPVLQIGIYWAVMALGLKVRADAGIPLAWMLIAGMTPWFAMNEAVASMTASISSNPSLVKRLVLPVSILPVATLAAAMAVHGVIILVAVAALWVMGVTPGLALMWLIYFAFCLAAFALAVGVMLAVANVLLRDIGSLVGTLLTLWFWATPLIWPRTSLPSTWRWLALLNPLDYIVQGYRFAMLNGAVEPPTLMATAWFWAVTGLIATLSWRVFRHFGRELADFL